MNSNRLLSVLAAMLALLATILEAKSVEHRYRHMRDASIERTSDNNKQDPAQRSSTYKHHTPRRNTQPERKRRGFARWSVQDDYQRFSRWQPSAYTLNRPYFIPIYGPAGQIPIFFPPQPINHNVGVPPDNPIPFMAPTYLPPKQTTVKPETTNTTIIENRFPFIDDDDDEPRPVWGGNVQTTKATTTTRRPRPQQRPAVIPTRPPRPKTTTQIPPLVHQINDGKIPLNAFEETKETEEAIANIFGGSEDYRPQQTRPFKESRPNAGSSTVLRTTTTRPRTTTIPTSTTRESSGPSNCVWAVVSCCSATSTKVAEACFEQRGCPGPFWDRSPCESDFAKAAINKALEYYGQ